MRSETDIKISNPAEIYFDTIQGVLQMLIDIALRICHISWESQRLTRFRWNFKGSHHSRIVDLQILTNIIHFPRLIRCFAIRTNTFSPEEKYILQFEKKCCVVLNLFSEIRFLRPELAQ